MSEEETKSWSKGYDEGLIVGDKRTTARIVGIIKDMSELPYLRYCKFDLEMIIKQIEK